jgi:cyanate lyase
VILFIRRGDLMTKAEMTSAIVDAKARAGLTWEAIATGAGLSPVFVTSACLGMNSLSREAADKLCSTLELPVESVGAALQEFPHKSWDTQVPTDPVVYRFYEMIHVYGDTIKALIHEKFGDGIMSAIDFDMFIDRVPDPKGDRVKITMTGKFLPYKSW